MKLGYLAFKNMVSKPLNLLLSLMLLILSVSLVTFVLQLSQQMEGQLNKNIAPFDMVVGAKGSPLQLVLSSVLHIDVPTGNIKLKDASMLQKHPFVQTAIPVSYGDNYKGYRILGTEAAYLDHYQAQLSEGRLYEKSFEVVAGSNVVQRLGLKVGDIFISSHGLAASGGDSHDDHPFTITGILKSTGSVVDQLLITNLESVWEAHDHGEDGHDDETEAHDEHDHEEGHHHDDETDAHDDHEHGEGHHHDEETDGHDDHEHGEGHHHDDETDGHDDHEHGEGHHHDDETDGHDDHEHGKGHHHDEDSDGHDDHEHGEGHHHDEETDGHDDHDHGEHNHGEKEITSLLVKFKNPIGMVQLPRYINENTAMQAALPGFEIQRLMGLLGSGVQTINGIALAILLVSGLSIFISLLKTIRERRQELALLRTYGLRTRQLLGLALLEGLFLAFIGFVLGWLIGRLGLWCVSQFMQASYGYALKISGPQLFELLLLCLTLALAAIATLLASRSIFKLNVAKTLSDV